MLFLGGLRLVFGIILLLGVLSCRQPSLDPGPWTKVDTVATSTGSVKVTLAGSRRYLKPGDTLEVSMTMLALEPINVIRSDSPSYDVTVTSTEDKVLARWSSDQPPGSTYKLILKQDESKTVTFRWTTPSQIDTQETYVVVGTVAGNGIIFPIIVNQSGNP